MEQLVHTPEGKLTTKGDGSPFVVYAIWGDCDNPDLYCSVEVIGAAWTAEGAVELDRSYYKDALAGELMGTGATEEEANQYLSEYLTIEIKKTTLVD